jgi:hypothetical protein
MRPNNCLWIFSSATCVVVVLNSLGGPGAATDVTGAAPSPTLLGSAGASPSRLLEVPAPLQLALAPAVVADNTLTDQEKKDGWRLLFDGRTLDGWQTSSQQPSKTGVEEGALNPHGCGGYMLIHKEQWENFKLALDFKLSKACNSGVFLRTSPLTPRPGKDVGFNGLEIALDDTATAGYTDTGALYDLSKPTKNALRPLGEWNQLEITADKSVIEVKLNGEQVNRIDLDKFTDKNLRPDGTPHKFDVVYKDHPRRGYIGLQDHGSNCWFKNIKLKKLD